MSIRSSLKILLNNFSNVWKIMFYKFLVFLLAAGLVVGLVLPNVVTIINDISDTGLFENVNKIINDFFTRGIDITSDIEIFMESFKASSKAISENADRLFISYVFILLIMLFTSFLSGLSDLTLSDVIHGDMSANAKFSFSSRFIITLGSNLKYQLVRLLNEIPVFIIIAFIVWNIFSLLYQFLGLFSMFFAFVSFILLLSLFQTFFCCWLPEITVKRSKIFPSVNTAFKMVFPYFSGVLSGYVLINISVFFISVMLAFFTCGAGLLLSIPMCSMFYIIYRLVIYHDINGLKYYTDGNTIINPNNLS